jgi:hypothetical protein
MHGVARRDQVPGIFALRQLGRPALVNQTRRRTPET